MRAIIIVISFYLSGCGAYVFGGCTGDFMVDNFCVYVGDFAIDPAKVGAIKDKVILEATNKYGHKKQVDHFMRDHIIYLSFVNSGPKEELLEHYEATGLAITTCDNNINGPHDDCVVNIEILINYWPEFYDNCLENSSYAHEVIHVMELAIRGIDWVDEHYNDHPAGWFGWDSIEETCHHQYVEEMCGIKLFEE